MNTARIAVSFEKGASAEVAANHLIDTKLAANVEIFPVEGNELYTWG